MTQLMVAKQSSLVMKLCSRLSSSIIHVSSTNFSIDIRKFSTTSSLNGSQRSGELTELANNIIKAPVSRWSETETEELCKLYTDSNTGLRNSFILSLSSNHSSNVDASTRAAKDLVESKPGRTLKAIESLRKTTVPDYYRLFLSISKASVGIGFLVGLRRDILNISQHIQSIDDVTTEKVNTMDGYLKGLLSHWLTVGLLKLEPLTWHSPASLLEKVSRYEAVHPMTSWNDLKRRVGSYRRVFVFTHRSLPNEPLVILHIALTKDISERIMEIIPSMAVGDFVSNKSVGTEQNPIEERFSTKEEDVKEDLSQVEAAIFYSISSPQRGLQGIELGTVMIREVARKIALEYPGIRKFSSLSPIPGFRDHLLSQIQSFMTGNTSNVPHFINSTQLLDLKDSLSRHINSGVRVKPVNSCEPESQNYFWNLLHETLRTNSWVDDEDLSKKLYLPLMRKCAHYLYWEKNRGYALNPVAHFHMKNGSVMWRLNWKGDTSGRGLKNSCGIMVNYRYYIEDVETNSQRYIEDNYIPTSAIFNEFLSIDPDQHEKYEMISDRNV